MTLPTSGALSLGQAATEAGVGLPVSLGDAAIRTLAGVPSGPISLTDLYGKTAGGGGPPPPAPSPLTVQTQGGTGSSDSSLTGGSVACFVTATTTGGVGPITHLWEFTSNPGQFTLSNSNSATARVSRNYTRYSNGAAEAQLRYTARDSTGAEVVAQPVSAWLEWGSGDTA